MSTRSLFAVCVALTLSALVATAEDSRFDVVVREKKGEELEVVAVGERGIGKAIGLKPGDNIVWYHYQWYDNNGKLQDGNKNSPKKPSDVPEFLEGKKGEYLIQVWREDLKQKIEFRGTVMDSPFNKDPKKQVLIFVPKKK